ncbi:tRNA dihydrouridine synthase Dus3 [Schizosaccharomyces japonicus yFS275]|uniref:tRNA-dihydrouridine(47) synthase [NAD(P)(+)] n=1 Tax=Schizosaccharomyces japonicus (strain yFS275 / FY16936) TaxID=402676 RepID=B6K3Q0_SCHJY|nr:tRNA dihydrouridine synthase Dus3 [Schizosaccharomyces japonicus yFS275]EEB08107.2 tRNA dihydrouridine synthase Dus3 [Schizosaccharomyces japonicus yFS275]
MAENGVAAIKKEFLAEPAQGATGEKRKRKERGQNKRRNKVIVREDNALCPRISLGEECPYGAECRFPHDVEAYLAQKKPDIGKVCTLFDKYGRCPAGFKCRWLSGHVREDEDGNHVLVTRPDAKAPTKVTNSMNKEVQKKLRTKQLDLSKSEEVIALVLGPMNKDDSKQSDRNSERQAAKKEKKKEIEEKGVAASGEEAVTSVSEAVTSGEQKAASSTEQAAPTATEPPTAQPATDTSFEGRAFLELPTLRPQEKKVIDWRNRMVLAPLTTVGNPAFRQLCASFGADTFYSEMALCYPLMQGHQPEWALVRGVESERQTMKTGRRGIFGIQLACGKLWQGVKTAQVLSEYCDGLDFLDLNCGCPIDLVYRQGAGSALLDNHTRLIRSLQGIDTISGSLPTTVKLRMGCRDDHPIAKRLMTRIFHETNVSAVTLHGRSRQQRYSKLADWDYVRQCATEIRTLNEALEEKPDAFPMRNQRMAVIGNGDCFTYKDWYDGMETGVDTVMIARGALVKPWIFEEIEARQSIDKSSTQRLEMLQEFCNHGLSYWGADERGLNTTRRFFLEFMSFFHRYTPVAMYEEGVNPKLNERAPAYKARDDMEAMLASPNVADWISLSERFLGPTPPRFTFTPKHKSNSMDEAEG